MTCLLLLLNLGCAPTAVETQPKTILAVFAHPDDEAFVGPLLAHYARQGVRVHLAIVTEAGKGPSPRTGVPAGPELARLRAEEARCSCRELGIEAPSLLGFKDGELGRLNDPPAGYLAELVRESERRRLETDAVRKLLPPDEASHLVSAATEASGELVLVMDSPSWAARVRYCVTSLPAQRVSIRVLPRG